MDAKDYVDWAIRIELAATVAELEELAHELASAMKQGDRARQIVDRLERRKIELAARTEKPLTHRVEWAAPLREPQTPLQFMGTIYCPASGEELLGPYAKRDGITPCVTCGRRIRVSVRRGIVELGIPPEEVDDQ